MSLNWPYRFIFTLSEEELRRRRDALDLRGYYAQLSAIAVILIICASRLYYGAFRSKLTARSWWDSSAFKSAAETRRQYLVALSWLGWLLSLSVWNSGDGMLKLVLPISRPWLMVAPDYLHLTKALAHVALSQIPIQILLAPTSFIFASNPTLPSILSYVTSIPQTTLAPYHRLFGRLVIVPLLCGHAMLYLLFYVQVPHPTFGTVFSKRIRDPDVQYGLSGVSCAILILICGRSALWRVRHALNLTSLDVRRRVFYTVHLILVTGFLTLAYLHVAYARVFVLESIGVSLANLACCWLLA